MGPMGKAQPEAYQVGCDAKVHPLRVPGLGLRMPGSGIP